VKVVTDLDVMFEDYLHTTWPKFIGPLTVCACACGCKVPVFSGKCESCSYVAWPCKLSGDA
jgi:hypothetical protein